MARRTGRKDVGAWLGGNRGTVQSRMPSGASDREAQADAGGGQMEQVRAELGLGAYAAGIGTTAAIGAGVAAIKSGSATKVANKASRVLGQSLKPIQIVEQFPRLNKKQLALLREVEKGGPDIAKNLVRASRSGDVSSVLEDIPRFSKLKPSDVSAVADRLARQSQSSLRQAGFGDTIKVWRTQSVDATNVPDRIVSVTTRKGGIGSFQKTTNVTVSAKVKRSDVLAEYVTPRGSSKSQYLEQEMLVPESALRKTKKIPKRK